MPSDKNTSINKHNINRTVHSSAVEATGCTQRWLIPDQ